ncbi:MAG: alpha-glucosidase C-terminal domain-containing protein [Verrucomicrobia bacterium]|nr:alpha-glucosidase C-terminal domain-containing protein [Verrucomicrobiota bacterium]MBU4496466.1 alpha-glucosidase C-terminal domain-containing protein [Verrucomicrobiota bacterium]MCG2679678.1 alpha-glucosidase C-terminal domain-containing protein [Kiritimatiellia bacterium]
MTCRSALVVALAATICVASAAQDRPAWLNDGPVYETHPSYYDGTFKGLTKQIPSIAALGVKTIYLMPIWEHPKGQSACTLIYLITDYLKIDPAYGTAGDLKELVATAHKHGLKVLFDLVTTATPPGSVPWKNGWLYTMALSELKNLAPDLQEGTIKGVKAIYRRDKSDDPRSFEVFGRIVGDDRVVLHHYPHANFGPAVDRTHPDVIKYFSDVAAHYVKEYDIDGWRVDSPPRNWNPKIVAGAHSSLDLLRSVKKAIRAAKQDAVLLAEGPWLVKEPNADPVLDEMHEASYSYLFRLSLQQMKTSEQLVRFLADEKVWYGRTRARFTETHDTGRTARIAPRLARPLLVLISTIPGIPMIQAGQEIGATSEWFHLLHSSPPGSELALDPRVDWSKGDQDLRAFTTKLFTLRNRNEALKSGSIRNVWKAGDTTYAYARCSGDEVVVVAISLHEKPTTCVLDVPLRAGDVLVDALTDETFRIDDSTNVPVTLPAFGSRILQVRRRERLPRNFEGFSS